MYFLHLSRSTKNSFLNRDLSVLIDYSPSGGECGNALMLLESSWLRTSGYKLSSLPVPIVAYAV